MTKQGSTKLDRWLLCAVVALIHLNVFPALGRGAGVLAIGLFAIGLACRSWITLQVLLLHLIMSVQADILPVRLLAIPSVGFYFPFLVSSALVLPFPGPRNQLRGWIRHGRIDRNVGVLLLLTGAASTAALLGWAHWTDHLGVAVHMARGLDGLPRWVVLGVAVPAFGLLNALAEEIVYRGVFLEALSLAFPERRKVVILLQASAFAAAHYAFGFPNGAVGYGMVLVYGAMLGYLRLRTGGMLAPYLAHVIADLCIGYFIAA